MCFFISEHFYTVRFIQSFPYIYIYYIYIYIYIEREERERESERERRYICIGHVPGVMVIVIGKWSQRPDFKSRTMLFTFHIMLIPLGKVCIQLSSLQLWVNSRTGCALWLGNQSRRRENNEFKPVKLR